MNRPNLLVTLLSLAVAAAVPARAQDNRHRLPVVGLPSPAPVRAQDDIVRDFRTPPEGARPMTWWHWMNGNITKEGITADLEAMKRIGLGGAQIFNVAQGEPAGPVKFMSPEWRKLTEHAISEANRLGLKLAIHNCAGWSESGFAEPPERMSPA